VPTKVCILNLCSILFLFSFSGCILNPEKIFESADYLNQLDESNISFRAIPIDANPSMTNHSGTYSKRNSYKIDKHPFLIIECESENFAQAIQFDSNNSFTVRNNQNLVLITEIGIKHEFVSLFRSLKPPLSYRQAGIFIYPLIACLLLAVFIIAERSYSLRAGLTFPRKVEKALRTGEFPNHKWKRRSSAERIVQVALREKPSQEALLAYSRLEIAALEKGLFILEVVVAAAPLIGLLGTATGLVQVFSAMPANGLSSGTEIFSEGIALALFTTIIGLAIAIPALIGHAYLIRIVEKRAASLDWLTARLIDAVGTNKVSYQP
jgi:biopolymer transport protein ExbB